MIINELKNKKIAILGLGIENYALVKFLLSIETRRGASLQYDITIRDARSKKELSKKHKELAKNKNIKWRLGRNYNKKLYGFDILFRSPGWPVYKIRNSKFEIRNSIISSPMKLFFAICPTKNIIGVTGTKGKGTTASLIYEILKKAGKRVWLGGNIGVAPFEFLNKIKKSDWVVLELSSFQLEDMEASPRIAVITNLYSEHLAPADPNNPNYHKSLGAYLEAKLNIAKWQSKNDFFVQSSKLQLKTKNFKGKKIFFSKSELPSRLIGEHNKENIAAAVSVAKIVGVKDNIIKKAVKGFKGLEHRLEFVKSIRGIKYYNDSFATTPESAIIALKSFKGPVILIAGGAEKSSNFKKFAKEAKGRVKFIILLKGDATPRIKKELLQINYPKDKIKLAKSMKEAVKIARTAAKAGDTALLSPACASFGMFKNYKERGELFKLEVRSKKIIPLLTKEGLGEV